MVKTFCPLLRECRCVTQGRPRASFFNGPLGSGGAIRQKQAFAVPLSR
jgi:hypothetical protein